jgi:hypothetical protein
MKQCLVECNQAIGSASLLDALDDRLVGGAGEVGRVRNVIEAHDESISEEALQERIFSRNASIVKPYHLIKTR